jgi:hypothetical protein
MAKTNNNSQWTVATAQNVALTIPIGNASAVSVTITPYGTVSTGTVTFEVCTDGQTWYAVELTPLSGGAAASTSVVTSGVAWQGTAMAGFGQFRVRLSTVITGTGSVLVGIGTLLTAA